MWSEILWELSLPCLKGFRQAPAGREPCFYIDMTRRKWYNLSGKYVREGLQMDNNYNNGQQDSQNCYGTQNPSDAQAAGSRGLAVGSMITGIIAFLISCCYPVSAVLAVVSLILGIISLNKEAPGKGMAIAGLILSVLSLAAAVVFIAVSLASGEWVFFDMDALMSV